jgi:hypothetical protein
MRFYGDQRANTTYKKYRRELGPASKSAGTAGQDGWVAAAMAG